MGSIENGASLRLIHNLSLSLTCFDRAKSLHHNLSGHFSFLHSYDEKNRQKMSITNVIKCPVWSTILWCGDAHMLHCDVRRDEIDAQYTING